MDEAQEVMKQIEPLNQIKGQLEAGRPTGPTAGGIQDLTTVCEVCGNFMSAKDNEERMISHFQGKIVSLFILHLRIGLHLT